MTQKLVGMLRARSFSMTLGKPNGQRAATRKGLGGRPSWRVTAERSLEATGTHASGFTVESIAAAGGVGSHEHLLIPGASKPWKLLLDYVDLLTGVDHTVAFAGGAFDAVRGVKVPNKSFLSGVMHLGVVQPLFEDRDLGAAIEDILQG